MPSIGSYLGRWQGERETSVEEQKTGKSNRKSIIFECNTKIKASYKVKKKSSIKINIFPSMALEKRKWEGSRGKFYQKNQITVKFSFWS